MVIKDLPENQFIQEQGYKKNPFPAWLVLFLLTTLLALIWGGSTWYSQKMDTLIGKSPFLQVTNRDISLFLWQNPEFMRINSKIKNGYLPAFQYVDKITLDVAQADQIATAPPDLLFRYHTWNRLLKDEFINTPISKKQFIDFLSYAEEWHPRYWFGAPKGYIDLVANLKNQKEDDLSKLSQDSLPMDVKIAFQGWKNYFLDGEAVNNLKPNYKQIKAFLSTHPHYARNYWKNIVEDHTPNYLKSVGTQDSNDPVPQDELISFLRLAYYNYSMH